MFIHDINPFIRYASKSIFSPLNDYVYTYDCRLFYVIEGKCTIDLLDNTHCIESGTVVLFHSGTKYRFTVNTEIIMIVLNFDFTQQNNNITESMSPVFEKNYDKSKVLEKIKFCDCDALNQPLILKNAHYIEHDLLQIVEEYNKQKIFFKEKASGLLKKIIIEIARNASATSFITPYNIDIIIEYIQNNYKNKIDNKMLGNLVGYHPYHLNRLMLMYTGTTLHQYLLNYRIECAKKYLVTTELSISEIAVECGFVTVSHFSNSFKAKVGISPLQYRNERKNLV